jgi:hypothetical protein
LSSTIIARSGAPPAGLVLVPERARLHQQLGRLPLAAHLVDQHGLAGVERPQHWNTE